MAQALRALEWQGLIVSIQHRLAGWVTHWRDVRDDSDDETGPRRALATITQFEQEYPSAIRVLAHVK